MRLFLKLFLSHLLVALLALGLLLLLAEAFAPAFYRGHVERMYHVLAMMGGGMMAEALRQDLEKGLRSTLTAALLSALPLSALGALLTALFASLRLYRTARLLAEGSRRMAQGEYGIRLPLLERDELGELALHFNRLAEALEKVERTRAELIGTVAHELRTPLAALQGYAEGLMDGVLSKEKAAEGILREVKALGRLVEDLSLVSRVEAKAVEIRPRPLDPKGLLEEAFTRFQSAFQAKGVALRLEAPEGLSLVWADEERVLQVLANLLTNALRHTPPGGEVCLGAFRQGEAVAFQVEDTGPGIPPEHLPHIFERFYRVDKARSRKEGGSGVGLTVAKGLVEAMGGGIWVESQVGQGSRFTFTLPLYTGLTGKG
ncbi:sensor histidine kinase [Thermus scotoductus]|uniref:histidine kinase n=2 Tax=Thermus scotoductus TaxID=37636 RepID=A0A430R0T4_THESC|nr:HAMP domain-containing sensor histidine kinase [Thermus scotoductus]RTG93039.1 two-component sensor histidine kinase [Thermus scotoductus]RTH01002.1 two-component sensor histidine kinase [Thermus scotoductus]RTH96934.1 two-component sensor histidine kinase [Thermus scotoductus]RTI26888.1 two-component sensor histidine kinase [Thermus scotoductus]